MIGIALKLIDVLIGYATKRSDQRTTMALEELKASVETNRQKSEIVRAQLGHWIAWFPRFLAEMAATLYFVAVIIDSIWDLEGSVLTLPPAEAAIMATIFAGMFLKATFGNK
jgi:hypothetical protein